MKKIFIIFLSSLLVFSSFYVVPPKEKAGAISIGAVLPAGITVGAGIYTLGALAVGGLAIAVGIDQGEEINKHAKNVWAGATDLAKDSLKSSLDLMSSTGESVLTLGTDVKNFIKSKAGAIASISAAVISASQEKDLPTTETSYSDVDGANAPITVTKATKFPESVMAKSYYWDTVDLQLPTTSENVFYVQGANGLLAYKKINIDYNWQNGFRVQMLDRVLDDGTRQLSRFPLQELLVLRGYALTNTPSQILYSDMPVEINTVAKMEMLLKDIHTTEELLALLTEVLGLDNVFVGNQDIFQEYLGQKAKVGSLENLINDGIALELDNVYPYVQGTDTPLTLDPDGTLTLPDGAVYNGEVDWVMPRVTTLELDGVAIPVSISLDGVVTNILTGEIVGQVDLEKPGTGIQKPQKPPDSSKFLPFALIMKLLALLIALIQYLVRMFMFIVTLGLIEPTPINNPAFIWFTNAEILGIKPYPLVKNLALFLLGFSIYKSVRRVFG